MDPENRPRVTIHMAASLDGFIARKDGSVDWMETADDFEDGEELGPDFVEEFHRQVDAFVMGSKTYETARGFERQGFGWPYRDKPVYVFTSRPLEKHRTSVECVGGVLRQVLDDVVKPKHRNIWVVGGRELVNECLKSGVADEICVAVLPIAIGEGIPFFGPLPHDVALHLTGVKAYKNGMVELKYEVRRPERGRDVSG